MSLSKLLYAAVACASLIFTVPLHAVEPTTFPGPKKDSLLIKKGPTPKQVKTKKPKTPDSVATPQKEPKKKNKINK